MSFKKQENIPIDRPLYAMEFFENHAGPRKEISPLATCLCRFYASRTQGFFGNSHQAWDDPQFHTMSTPILVGIPESPKSTRVEPRAVTPTRYAIGSGYLDRTVLMQTAEQSEDYASYPTPMMDTPNRPIEVSLVHVMIDLFKETVEVKMTNIFQELRGAASLLRRTNPISSVIGPAHRATSETRARWTSGSHGLIPGNPKRRRFQHVRYFSTT